MIRFTHALTIRRNARDVYAFLADPVNLAKWNWFVERVRPEPGEPDAFEATRKTDRFPVRIVERDATRGVIVIETRPPGPPLQMRFTVRATADGARVEDEWALDLGVPRLVERLAHARVQRAVHENLTRLAALLENGTVTLQDGRRATIA